MGWNEILTPSIMTREMIRLVRNTLGHGFLYDPRYREMNGSLGLVPGDLETLGITVHQIHVECEIETPKLLLSLDYVSRTILLPLATALAERLKQSKALVTFDLMLPPKGESCRHVMDGLSMRGIIETPWLSSQSIIRWDIMFGVCDYEAMKRLAA